MAKSAQKKANSTQRFIEIVDIVDDIVILHGGYACLVVKVQATNFALLSPEEQDAMIYAYAGLLNSLSYSIQIVIRSKRFNVSSYLKQLEKERLLAKNPVFANQIAQYRDFVAALVKINTILDKQFYIVIYYSSLESGLSGAKSQIGVSSSQSLFVVGAKASLHSKAEGLTNQLQRLNLKSEVLGKEKLIKFYYDVFNDVNIDSQQSDNFAGPQPTDGGNK